jgi:hypothetical protein
MMHFNFTLYIRNKYIYCIFEVNALVNKVEQNFWLNRQNAK